MPAPDSVAIMTLAYAQGRIWRPPAHDVSCMCVRDVLMALAQALRCPWSPPPKWSALPTVTAAASPPKTSSSSNMRRRSSPPPIGSTSTAAKSNRSWQLCVPSLHRPTCRWVPAVAAQGCHRVGTAAATSSVRPCQGRPPGGLRAPANELADPRSGRERAPTAGSPVPGGVQLLPGRSRYRRARPWSAMLGRYDNWSATRCARCAEFGVTEALPLITGDTVAIETRAAIRDIGYLWATDPASKTAPRLTGVLSNHSVVSGASAGSSWKRLPLSLRLGHAASNGREPRRRRETPWRT